MNWLMYPIFFFSFRMPPLLLYDRLRHHELYQEADQLEVELLELKLEELHMKSKAKIKEEKMRQKLLLKMLQQIDQKEK